MSHRDYSYITKRCSQEPAIVDKILVSTFLRFNNIALSGNRMLSDMIIRETNSEYYLLMDFEAYLKREGIILDLEKLIEYFEFIISPSDKVVNGAVYTPLLIRDVIIMKTLSMKHVGNGNCMIADIACGCGGFLCSMARKLRDVTGLPYYDIYRRYLYGLDIQEYAIKRAKILLSLLALSEGEDDEQFDFNLYVGDALSFDWGSVIRDFNGFDIVIGNPPYVGSKHLTEETRELLNRWEVCKSGNPDLYIPFFQIGLELLKTAGVLGYITMNTFFKSLNGRSLRRYLQNMSIGFEIIDFGAQQVFQSHCTYTCLCIFHNVQRCYLTYQKAVVKKHDIFFGHPKQVAYLSLDHITGWNLYNAEIIRKIESTGSPFRKLYRLSHGLATLKNDIYIFKPVREDQNYYYLLRDSVYPIEKGICLDIVNSNRINESTSLDSLAEKIIYPYLNSDKPLVMDELYLREMFPMAYNYLLEMKNLLSTRDKGKGRYDRWYAYGRTQSLRKVKNKVLFPKITQSEVTCLLSTNENLMFYNGIAIIGHNVNESKFIQKIVESRLFWLYIRSSGKPYSSNYYSLSGGYINNFGIYPFNEAEKNYIISETDRNRLNIFIEDKYGINILDFDAHIT